MTSNPPDQRVVYLALKEFFKGPNSQIGKAKKVREVIQRAQVDFDVRDLIQQHNIENVCSVTRSLLEQQLFESTLKAKICLPEVIVKTSIRKTSLSSIRALVRVEIMQNGMQQFFALADVHSSM